MFAFATTFNAPIGGWDVSETTDMASMFHGADAFHQCLPWHEDFGAPLYCGFTDAEFKTAVDEWIEDSGTAEVEYGPIKDWDVSRVTYMTYAFEYANTFDADIGAWDVSKVTDMHGMFDGAEDFNQDIGAWDVSKVTDMRSMFWGPGDFNQDIGAWDVSKVTDMRSMFRDATTFDQDIGAWDVSKVTDMRSMFRDATTFDQDIGGWDVDPVTDMDFMFDGADAFHQCLPWNEDSTARRACPCPRDAPGTSAQSC